MLELGTVAQGQRRVLDVAPPHMRALSKATNLTVTLSLWSVFGPIVSLVSEPSTHPVLLTVRAGTRLGPESAQTRLFLALSQEAPSPGAQPTEVAPGGSSSNLGSPYFGVSASKVAEAARLPGVAAAAGGITLLEASITFPKNGTGTGQTSGYTIDGVYTADASLGPLGSASLVSGHLFTAAESDSDVAVLDSVYANSHGLTAGSAVTVDRARYTVIGIVSQPQGSSLPSIYVPLARAQAMGWRYTRRARAYRAPPRARRPGKAGRREVLFPRLLRATSSRRIR
jgi:hypothetical protein